MSFNLRVLYKAETAVTGDLNAKLGPDDARFTYNTQTNRNGDHLVDFMEEFNLFPANTSFIASRNLRSSWASRGKELTSSLPTESEARKPISLIRDPPWESRSQPFIFYLHEKTKIKKIGLFFGHV
jgi:hypothetical protein